MGYQEDFIAIIAPYVTSWRNFTGYGVASAIIAQACIESGYGKSNKAQHNNYFGLKYKPGRVSCNSGVFYDTSYEWVNGQYVPIITQWYEFADMYNGVGGYFQFINYPRYNDARKQTDPETYLLDLWTAGYATGPKYVENCMRVVNQYNLTKYDKKGDDVGYKQHPIDPNRKPDSPLALKAMWTGNNTYPRQTNKKPNEFTIIPHCIAGNPTAEAQAAAFQNPNRGASAHYIIDSKGIIIQGVPEDCRAWTTGGDLNVNGLTGAMMDHEAITFEIANVTREPLWAMSAEAINSLVLLMVDICRRNGIPCVKWQGNKFLAGHPDQQNIAAHRWFARKSCPGDFLYNSMGAVADTVNFYLAADKPQPLPVPNEGFIINGLDYSPVFNPKTYAASRPDVAANPYYGASDEMLWKHFCDFGMKEFFEEPGLAQSKTSEEFCVQAYKNRYSDLRDAFGDDFFEYYKHYIMFGKNEGRNAL